MNEPMPFVPHTQMSLSLLIFGVLNELLWRLIVVSIAFFLSEKFF